MVAPAAELIALLVVLTAAIYSRISALDGEFVYDDDSVVGGNPLVRGTDAGQGARQISDSRRACYSLNVCGARSHRVLARWRVVVKPRCCQRPPNANPRRPTTASRLTLAL